MSGLTSGTSQCSDCPDVTEPILSFWIKQYDNKACRQRVVRTTHREPHVLFPTDHGRRPWRFSSAQTETADLSQNRAHTYCLCVNIVKDCFVSSSITGPLVSPVSPSPPQGAVVLEPTVSYWEANHASRWATEDGIFLRCGRGRPHLTFAAPEIVIKMPGSQLDDILEN